MPPIDLCGLQACFHMVTCVNIIEAAQKHSIIFGVKQASTLDIL